jgi:hypothetical protein
MESLTLEKTFQCILHVLVGDKKVTVSHPRIPLANKVCKSSLLRHSLSRG